MVCAAQCRPARRLRRRVRRRWTWPFLPTVPAPCCRLARRLAPVHGPVSSGFTCPCTRMKRGSTLAVSPGVATEAPPRRYSLLQLKHRVMWDKWLNPQRSAMSVRDWDAQAALSDSRQAADRAASDVAADGRVLALEHRVHVAGAQPQGGRNRARPQLALVQMLADVHLDARQLTGARRRAGTSPGRSVPRRGGRGCWPRPGASWLSGAASRFIRATTWNTKLSRSPQFRVVSCHPHTEKLVGVGRQAAHDRLRNDQHGHVVGATET